MNKNALLLIVFFFSLQLSSQNSNFEEQKAVISNLLKQYKKTKDTLLIKKALFLSKETKNDSILREVNIVYGLKSYFKNDLENLRKSEQNLYQIFKRSNDSLALAKHYHYKAMYYRKKFITDSCFFYYHKSKDISLLLKDSLKVGRRLLSMARIQETEKDYLGSEITTIEGLRYLEPLNEHTYTGYFYNNLGLILTNLRKSKEARIYFEKAFNLGKKNPKTFIRERTFVDYYNNTGRTFEKESNHNKAIEYFSKIFTIDSLETKFSMRYANAIENIGYNNFKLGKEKLALDAYLKVLKIREDNKNAYGLSVTNSLLAKLYLEKKAFTKAKKHALKGIEYAHMSNNSLRLLENYKYLSQIEKGEKGKDYLKKYIALNDSLITRERNLKNQFAKVRYETEKKEIENAALKSENQRKQLALDSEKQQKTIGWLAAGVSFLFIAFGVTIAANRRKKLVYKSKLQQVEAREKERQQIAKSLHDEVAGDIRALHLKLVNTHQVEEAKNLDIIKENVRHLSHQLSSVSFEEVSFKNQIINLVSDYFDADFRVKIKEINAVEWKKLNSVIKRTLFLTIRESLQNIDKYAEAKNVILSFSETKKAVFLTINDDGKGFDVDAKKKGIGLKNMKERIEEINGNFSLISEIKKGTTIRIEIPKNGR